eukprot:2460-Pelagococcus_subviridis.AAC.3
MTCASECASSSSSSSRAAKPDANDAPPIDDGDGPPSAPIAFPHDAVGGDHAASRRRRRRASRESSSKSSSSSSSSRDSGTTTRGGGGAAAAARWRLPGPLDALPPALLLGLQYENASGSTRGPGSFEKSGTAPAPTSNVGGDVLPDDAGECRKAPPPRCRNRRV